MFSAAYEKRRAAAVGLRDSETTSSGQDAYRGPGAGHKAAGQRGWGPPTGYTDSMQQGGWTSAHIQLLTGAPWRASSTYPGSSPKAPAEGRKGRQEGSHALGATADGHSISGQARIAVEGMLGIIPTVKMGALTGSATGCTPKAYWGF